MSGVVSPWEDPRAFAAAEYFRDLQNRICASFESFEEGARFEKRNWSKPQGHRLQGGGESRLMRAQVFEKVGVNVSHVWGLFSSQARGQIPGPKEIERLRSNPQMAEPASSISLGGLPGPKEIERLRSNPQVAEPASSISVGGLPGAEESQGQFVACGISLVAHMRNPYVPTVHMNLRYLRTSRGWFGGGADLTPTFPIDSDTALFHEALRQACDSYRPDAYAEYKAWCDRYFYLPHRQEPRGVGGIFFDELTSGEAEKDFAFVKAVGEAFLGIYPRIVALRKDTPFDDEARERQLVKRGRYVEFNLVYDRGTKFGFSTDADPEAYLMSLPPLVKW